MLQGCFDTMARFCLSGTLCRVIIESFHRRFLAREAIGERSRISCKQKLCCKGFGGTRRSLNDVLVRRPRKRRVVLSPKSQRRSSPNNDSEGVVESRETRVPFLTCRSPDKYACRLKNFADAFKCKFSLSSAAAYDFSFLNP